VSSHRRRSNRTANRASGMSPRWGRSVARILVALWLLSLVPVLLWRYFDPPFTLLMLQRWLEAPQGSVLLHRWVDLEAVSPQLLLAVVAAEDQKFPWHNGFDLDSIAQAIEDARNGERLRGASTLSQQTAKNVFLWPGRSWLRKGLEAYYTVLIELFWGKRRILEVYVNLAETGPLTFGVEAASRRWLGTSAARLDAAQAALLAAVLPNPRQRSLTRPDRGVRARRDWILRQMRQLGRAHLDGL
jgi:monofunctional biosynthetic peptidoglycan transglycosylase